MTPRHNIAAQVASLGADSMLPDYADPPFAVCPDIVLDLPVPPSVNRLRKIDWGSVAERRQWVGKADALCLAGGVCRGRNLKLSRFEVHIALSEELSRADLDNSIKIVVDYLKRIELIEDDGPKHMRRLVVEFGLAPEGCRVTLRPVA